jgi:Ran GTPase-activating protein (RanGAP) involved in mRNA processing and transport
LQCRWAASLEIKKLKGVHPVESIGLSQRGLGAISAVVIASLISANGSLTSLDLSHNIKYGSSDGPAFAQALAPGIAANSSLTSLNLAQNGMGPDGAKALAPAIAANGSLTMVNMLHNKLDVESANMLAEVAKQKSLSLCGLQRDQTTADFKRTDLQLYLMRSCWHRTCHRLALRAPLRAST